MKLLLWLMFKQNDSMLYNINNNRTKQKNGSKAGKQAANGSSWAGLLVLSTTAHSINRIKHITQCIANRLPYLPVVQTPFALQFSRS